MAWFATIGHSNRSLDVFIGMLRDAEIGLLADVRAFPRSHNNSSFNIDTLPAELAPFQIGYRHFQRLGGRRPRQPGVDDALNALWRVRSFHNYADYALGDAFSDALEELIWLGEMQRVCLMCSEAPWWRCHRRIITDYLLMKGHAVDHLMAPGRIARAMLMPGAECSGTGKLLYPSHRDDAKDGNSDV